MLYVPKLPSSPDTFRDITVARSQREVVCMLEAGYVSKLANSVAVIDFLAF